MKRTIWLILGVMVLASVLVSVAGAFTTSEKVIVANDLVAIARVPAGGFTADQRIDQVNERLAYILGYEPLDPRHINAFRLGDSMRIMVGNRLLITVTPADARANNSTVSRLTRVWLERARAALPQARPTPAIPG